MKAGEQLLMPFIDGTKPFVHGFECGQIWEQAKNGNLFNDYPFHTTNESQVKMILELYSYQYTIERLDNPWCILSGSNKSELN